MFQHEMFQHELNNFLNLEIDVSSLNARIGEMRLRLSRVDLIGSKASYGAHNIRLTWSLTYHVYGED